MTEISKERIERAAQAIFEHWTFGAPVKWVPNGNSDKQDAARRQARAALTADAPALTEAERRGRIEGLREAASICRHNAIQATRDAASLNNETVRQYLLARSALHAKDAAAIDARIAELGG